MCVCVTEFQEKAAAQRLRSGGVGMQTSGPSSSLASPPRRSANCCSTSGLVAEVLVVCPFQNNLRGNGWTQERRRGAYAHSISSKKGVCDRLSGPCPSDHVCSNCMENHSQRVHPMPVRKASQFMAQKLFWTEPVTMSRWNYPEPRRQYRCWGWYIYERISCIRTVLYIQLLDECWADTALSH